MSSTNSKFLNCIACGKAHLDGEGHNFLPRILEAVKAVTTPALEGVGGCETCSPSSLLRHYEIKRELVGV